MPRPVSPAETTTAHPNLAAFITDAREEVSKWETSSLLSGAMILIPPQNDFKRILAPRIAMYSHEGFSEFFSEMTDFC